MSRILQNPRSSCALGGAVAAVTRIDRAIPIYHSGPGCALQTFSGQIHASGGHSSYVTGVGVPCTNMFQQEVIFGGAQRLRETIEGSLEVMDGDIYFVLTGCTADIIGDDTAGIVEEFVRRGYPIAHIETGGFKGDSYKGYESVVNVLASRLTLEPAKKQPKTVNLLGITPSQELFWAGNIEEISRLLNRIGVAVNSFFSAGQGIETIRSSSEAALNIIFSPWLCREAEQIYREKYGIESWRYSGIPVGTTATTAFLREIGERLQIDERLVAGVVEQEERYVYDYLETVVDNLTRYRFAIVGDTNTVLGLTSFLVNDYSQIPIAAVITDEIRDEDKSGITAVLSNLEYSSAPEVHFEQDQWKIQQILRRQDLRMILGSSFEKETADELDTIFFNVSFPTRDKIILNRTYAGYRGCLTLVEDMYYNF